MDLKRAFQLLTLILLAACAAAWTVPASAQDARPAADGFSVQYVPVSFNVSLSNPIPVPGPVALATSDPNVEGTAGETPANQTKEKAEGGEKSDKAEKDLGATDAPQRFNLHAQTTVVAQGDPSFPAKYSGPNSLNNLGERQESLAADLFAGVRLWSGAEVHVDGLMWQGYGLSQTFGIEDFSNGNAFKAGTQIPDFIFARLFIRQTFGLGGEQEDVPDGQLALAGKQDISRLTFTVGRFTPTDIFDNNTYAHDAHTQFLNWAAGTSVTWDNPSDTVGYTTGLAVEFNQPNWALRYGFFQMPGVQNGFTTDDRVLMWPGSGSDGSFFQSWGTMAELERRWKLDGHPGAIRFMAWLNEADMASYQVATAILRANPPGPNVPQGSGADVPAASLAIRNKHGFGLNWEQEVAKNVGMFSRLGWNDGHEEAWTYTDANWSASLGMSIRGAAWNRPDDTIGLVGVVSGASRDQQEFLEAGGLGILDGDGALSYCPEKVLETYYDFPIGKACHITMDYQFVSDPAFNSDRGPVSIFGLRFHWEQ